MDCASMPSSSSTVLSVTTHERLYLAWINSQLRKSGSLQIDKLQECADGHALTSLVEVLCGETLSVSNEQTFQNTEPEGKIGSVESQNEQTNGEARESKLRRVEMVLNAMRNRHIRMGTVNAADIVDGDQRAIMRVILALAAHFKPTTSRSQHAGLVMPPVINGVSSQQASTKSNSHSTTESPMTFGTVRRERTWQNFRDIAQANAQRSAKRSEALTQSNDGEPLSKRGDYEVELSGRFERSMTFDGATTLRQSAPKSNAERTLSKNGEAESGDLLFSFSRYEKMSDAEKLNSATRRGATKRQEWLEQRRKRFPPTSTNSTVIGNTAQPLAPIFGEKLGQTTGLFKCTPTEEQSTSLIVSSAVDEPLKADRHESPRPKTLPNAEEPSKAKEAEMQNATDPHSLKAVSDSRHSFDGTLRNVRETRELLTKLQCTILLDKVIDDTDAEASWTAESTSALIDSVLGEESNSESEIEKAAHATAVDLDPNADCIILRSRLDVALAKQRELARRLQHARAISANLARANATLRERLGERQNSNGDCESVSSAATNCTSEAVRHDDSSNNAERIAQLEAELTQLRSELRARDRLIIELVASRKDTIDGPANATHTNGSIDANSEKQVDMHSVESIQKPSFNDVYVAALNQDVDELSEITSRSLSAYSPSHETARSNFNFDDVEPLEMSSATNVSSNRTLIANFDTESMNLWQSAPSLTFPSKVAAGAISTPYQNALQNDRNSASASRKENWHTEEPTANAEIAFRNAKDPTVQNEEEEIL